MTGRAETSGLDHARDLTRLSAQWLRLISFTAFAGAVVFSPSTCEYHAMLDPGASDADRLGACRAMECSVQRRLHAEELAADAKRAQDRPVDPYDLHWRTTPEGAALWMIGQLLSAAIRSFEAKGVTD